MINSDEEMKIIAKRINMRREELNLSLQDVANKAGISKSTLQRYETGYIKGLPLSKISSLALALNTTPAYIMGWDEKEAPADKDRLQKEVDDLFINLPPEKQSQVLDFLRFLHGQSSNFLK